MELYLANFSGLDPKQARAAARSGRGGSVWGMSLLSAALERSLGLAALPELGEDAFGKPCFPAFPGLCFSVSHSGGWAACALHSAPVGVDLQRRREISPALASLVSPEEAEHWDFFQLWALRESLFKLRGRGDLRHEPFRPGPDGMPAAPRHPEARFRLYAGVPDYYVLALAWQDATAPPAAPRVLPAAALLRPGP